MFKKSFLVLLTALALSSVSHANQFETLQQAFDAYQELKTQTINPGNGKQNQIFEDIMEWKEGRIQDPEGKTFKDLNLKLKGGSGDKDYGSFNGCFKTVMQGYQLDKKACNSAPKDMRASCHFDAKADRNYGKMSCASAYKNDSGSKKK